MPDCIWYLCVCLWVATSALLMSITSLSSIKICWSGHWPQNWTSLGSHGYLRLLWGANVGKKDKFQNVPSAFVSNSPWFWCEKHIQIYSKYIRNTPREYEYDMIQYDMPFCVFISYLASTKIYLPHSQLWVAKAQDLNWLSIKLSKLPNCGGFFQIFMDCSVLSRILTLTLIVANWV